jgi:hypothetical protein
MRRSILKGTLVVLATGALVTGGLVAPALADDTDGHGGHDGRGGHDRQTVEVVGNGSEVTLDDYSIRAGKVSFEVSTTNAVTPEGGGSQITLFELNKGKTLDDVFAGLKKEFNEDELHPEINAAGTRELRAAATYHGLADVVPGYDEVVTEFLDRGTYYLVDLAAVDPRVTTPEVTTLKVRGHDGSDGHLRADVAVKARNDRFRAPDHWPATGSYTFTNADDTIHFMAMVPVQDGTTDQQVTEFVTPPDPGAPPAEPTFFKEGPSGGNDVVSPGYTIKVRYALPAGTYLLLCFVADEETGIPHVVMGMHKVVVLT